jgi:hypothetical protein
LCSVVGSPGDGAPFFFLWRKLTAKNPTKRDKEKEKD